MKNKMLKLTLICACLFCFTGCGEEKLYSDNIFAMDTIMTISAYGPNGQKAVEAAEEEIYALEKMLSTGLNDSEISKLNKEKTLTLSNPALDMIVKAKELGKTTDGAFNISIYPVMKLWGFDSNEFCVPSEAELETGLSHMDLSKVEVVDNTVSLLDESMELDLGGIAKGYTSQRIMEIFEEDGITSGMVSLGGNVQVFGRKPDGSKYSIAIQNPDNSDNYLGIVSVCDGQAVITSGGYQRYFEEGGITYHHIIDPNDGYPANNGLVSVSIISKDGMLADGLSTAIYVMGFDRAVEFWKSSVYDFDMILLDEKNDLYITEGIESDFISDEYNFFTITK